VHLQIQSAFSTVMKRLSKVFIFAVVPWKTNFYALRRTLVEAFSYADRFRRPLKVVFLVTVGAVAFMRFALKRCGVRWRGRFGPIPCGGRAWHDSRCAPKLECSRSSG